VKSLRQVAIADHLWDALERMAEEMGSDRDGLVNQALHAFVRANGFLVPALPGAEAGPEVTPRASAAERQAVAAKVLETAALLEQAIREPAPADGPRSLVLVREDGAEIEVAKDRFLIGRGRHCDLVIDSGKVSREHAAILREGEAWFVEDLGSANGTWHRRARVQRHRISDGDEYYVCAERVRCLLR